MKYYSEEEIRNCISTKTTLNVDALLELLTPTIVPALKATSSDRERIRMELWKELFISRPFDQSMLNKALEAFDKQFPNS